MSSPRFLVPLTTALTGYLSVGGTMFKYFTNAGNTTTAETDLFTNTILANTFDSNGDSVEAVYGGTFNGSGANKRLRVYFDGVVMFDSTALSAASTVAWVVRTVIVRVSATVLRSTTVLSIHSATMQRVSYVEQVGLTLTAPQVLKLTGQASGGGAATNDIVARMGTVDFKPGV